jgi:hypothetical protein
MKTKIFFTLILALLTVSCHAQDFNKPANNSSKSGFPNEVRANDIANAKMDPSAGSNLQSGMMRYNRTTDTFQELTLPSTWTNAPIDGTSLVSSTVTTAKIADSNVTTAKVADSNITEAKLADDAATRHTKLIFGLAGNAIGSQSAVQIPIQYSTAYYTTVMPYAGKVTALTVDFNEAITGGNTVAILYKNGSNTTKTVTISSGTSAYATFSETFAAGDKLDLRFNANSTTTSPGTNIGMTVAAWGHFTE